MICQVSLCYPETYLEPCQTSKMERFAKIVNHFLVTNMPAMIQIQYLHIEPSEKGTILRQAKKDHTSTNIFP